MASKSTLETLHEAPDIPVGYRFVEAFSVFRCHTLFRLNDLGFRHSAGAVNTIRWTGLESCQDELVEIAIIEVWIRAILGPRKPTTEERPAPRGVADHVATSTDLGTATLRQDDVDTIPHSAEQDVPRCLARIRNKHIAVGEEYPLMVTQVFDNIVMPRGEKVFLGVGENIIDVQPNAVP